MKILDRYIIRQFLLFLITGTLLFVFIFIIVDISDNLSHYIDAGRPLREIVMIYVYQIPSLVRLLFPIGSLIALFFSVGMMVKRNEFAAVKAGGISPYRFLAPLFMLIIILSGLMFIFNETIVVKSNRNHREIVEHKSFISEYTRDFHIIQSRSLMLSGRLFNADKNTIKKPEIFVFDRSNQLIEHITAENAYYDRGTWVFETGSRMHYGDDYNTEEFEMERMEMLTVKPSDIIIDRSNTDIYTIDRLKNIIHSIRKSGYPFRKQATEILYRYFFIIITLIIIIIGSAFVIRIKTDGILFGLAMSIFISFLYWGVLQGFRSSAENGYMHPLSAMLIPNLFFLLAAGTLFYKARK